MKRRKEGLLWECLHPSHVGIRMRPRGWFARKGRTAAGEEQRHVHCRECRRESLAAHAAKRRGAGVKRIPAGWVRLLWERQRGMCSICGRWLLGTFHVEHVIPVSRGGEHTLANLALAHPLCNTRKSNKLL